MKHVLQNPDTNSTLRQFIAECDKIVTLETTLYRNHADTVLMSAMDLFGQNYKRYKKKIRGVKATRRWHTSVVTGGSTSAIADVLKNHLGIFL